MSREEAVRIAERLRSALDMYETGVSLMRQNLRRTDPHASEEEIEARLEVWLAIRPSAESGDPLGEPRKRSQ